MYASEGFQEGGSLFFVFGSVYGAALEDITQASISTKHSSRDITLPRCCRIYTGSLFITMGWDGASTKSQGPEGCRGPAVVLVPPGAGEGKHSGMCVARQGRGGPLAHRLPGPSLQLSAWLPAGTFGASLRARGRGKRPGRWGT